MDLRMLRRENECKILGRLGDRTCLIAQFLRALVLREGMRSIIYESLNLIER
jgi:hypothetical protein